MTIRAQQTLLKTGRNLFILALRCASIFSRNYYRSRVRDRCSMRLAPFDCAPMLPGRGSLAGPSRLAWRPPFGERVIPGSEASLRPAQMSIIFKA
jgi:hypothetical protein